MTQGDWQLIEIVSAIAANLVLDKARASAVALALCSKSFEGPALGEVWRSLSSLEPLVKCFPDIWEVEDKLLYFKRAPLRSEWTRFQQSYASKVRHLEVYPDEDVDPAALQLLHQLSDYNPLLPNLLSLYWDGNDALLPLISPLISRPLMSIVICVDHSTTPMLPPILTRLSTLSPFIREIQIEELNNDPSIQEASSQLLLQCNRLRICNIGVSISASALRHVIQLPSLEEFQLSVDQFQLPDPLPPVVFPNLRILNVEYTGDSTWLKLLPAIENPVLSEINVNCFDSDVEEFARLFELTMAGCGMQERLKVFNLVIQDRARESKIAPQVIAYSSSFKNLTSFEMPFECTDMCRTLDLTDNDIDLLTRAMPRLESLALGAIPCSVPSQITFKSLYTISSRCPRLTKLQIHFNADSFVDKVESGNVAFGQWDHPSSSDLCSVKMINVGSIEPSYQSNATCIMALGLLRVFPCLENLEDNDGAFEWRYISDMIKICRRIGNLSESMYS